MELLILFCLAVLQVDANQRCSGPIINEIYHTDELLKSDLDSPYSLSYDISTNSVYFSHFVHVSKINLDTKEFTYIDRPQGGFSVSVDPYSSDVYIGGDFGVYKYTKITNKSEIFGANGTNVRIVYSKRIIYFTDIATDFLYTIVDGVVSRFEDLKHTTVKQFVIDNDDWMFYSNSSGLFRQKKGTYDAVHYIGTEYMRNGRLNVDNAGIVHAVFTSGIYTVHKQYDYVRKIAEIRSCNGLAFDAANNIIYCDWSSVHRLMPSDEEGCV